MERPGRPRCMAAMGTRQCSEVDEPGPLRLGSHGRVWTAIGVPLPFTITPFDARHSWAWEVAGIGAARRRRRAAVADWASASGVRLRRCNAWTNRSSPKSPTGCLTGSSVICRLRNPISRYALQMALTRTSAQADKTRTRRGT
jgi:hypothetical protein